ncbi:hypothetical protein EDB19DRAFT_161432 [Suillus lakei]|nr:hypothetical protein EDB19DRAFT_161432 [Suillus lakei]
MESQTIAFHIQQRASMSSISAVTQSKTIRMTEWWASEVFSILCSLPTKTLAPRRLRGIHAHIFIVCLSLANRRFCFYNAPPHLFSPAAVRRFPCTTYLFTIPNRPQDMVFADDAEFTTSLSSWPSDSESLRLSATLCYRMPKLLEWTSKISLYCVGGDLFHW